MRLSRRKSCGLQQSLTRIDDRSSLVLSSFRDVEAKLPLVRMRLHAGRVQVRPSLRVLISVDSECRISLITTMIVRGLKCADSCLNNPLRFCLSLWRQYVSDCQWRWRKNLNCSVGPNDGPTLHSALVGGIDQLRLFLSPVYTGTTIFSRTSTQAPKFV